MHREAFQRILDNVERVIVGKRSVVELCLTALISEGHLLIEDVPGVGKTMMAYALAHSVDCSFRRIQFTPDILPSDITGFSLYNQQSGQFEYRAGLVMSHFVLADEINRTSPKTQASLLEVMEEKQVTVDGATYLCPAPFMVLATQNPTTYLGTYPLPEAQMDRFLMRVTMGYPELEDEVQILRRHGAGAPPVSPVLNAADVVRLQESARQVEVDPAIHRYIVALCQYTRRHEDVTLGVSPRGGLGLARAAQSWALYHRRGYVLPDDVRQLAGPVLAHRLILKQNALFRGVTPDAVIRQALDVVRIRER